MAFGINSLRRQCTATRYRAEIDGLRFFAIAIVVFGHVAERVQRFLVEGGRSGPTDRLFWPFLRAGDGVYLFFAISGFIIACQFLRGGSLSGKYIRNYFRRRVLRIEPPYFVVLIATYLVIGVFGFVPADVHRFWEAPSSIHVSFVASLFYMHDLIFGTMPRLFGPGWSLEIEVQFYTLAPLMFLLYFGTKRRGVRLVLGLALLALGVGGLLVHLPPSVRPHLTRSLFRFFVFFWIGVLFADFQEWMQRLPRQLMSIAGWFGAFCLLWVDAVAQQLGGSGSLLATIEIGSIILMFASVLKEGTSFRRFCSLPWISIIGGACYSIYLTHLQTAQLASHALLRVTHRLPEPVILASAFVLVGGLITVVGMVFYVVIERPCMNPYWPQDLWSRLRGRRIPARGGTGSSAHEGGRPRELQPQAESEAVR